MAMRPPGRPPKQLQTRTPQKATDAAQAVLSPIETKVAWDKEAGIFSRMGKATQKGVSKAGKKIKDTADKVRGFFHRPPPPPKVGRIQAGLGGAAAGSLALGGAAALNAKPGDRMDAFTRNAVLGAGLGGATGLASRGAINDVLAARHQRKLLKQARARTVR